MITPMIKKESKVKTWLWNPKERCPLSCTIRPRPVFDDYSRKSFLYELYTPEGYKFLEEGCYIVEEGKGRYYSYSEEEMKGLFMQDYSNNNKEE
jgi:hypothetical protein